MAPIASLVVRLSAQIAEFQKSFEDAFGTAAKFEKQFAGTASSIEKHQQDINKAFQSFAGDNIIREANVLAQAIGKVGGASKLTAAEQQKANATLKEAIDKYKALGETAPKALQDLEAATRKIPAVPAPPKSLFEGFASQAAGVATGMVTATAAVAAFTAAFDTVKSVIAGAFNAVTGAVEKTAALGDELFGLSQKTGLSVESLSGFKFAAAQTNTSLESISGAIFKLETNLGAGAKQTESALKGIGLSLKTLRGEDPAQAFTEIITKLGELPNASARAAAGVAIFGKSFKDIAQLSQESLPALISQAKELGVVMSQETAVAADRFKDAMGAVSAATDGLRQQLGAKLLPAAVAFAEVFGGIFIDAIKQVTKSTKSLGEGFDSFVVFIGEAAARFIEVLARMVEATAQWAADISKRVIQETKDFLDLAPSIIAVGRALDLAIGGGTHQSGFDALSKNLDSLRKALPSIESGAKTAGDAIRSIATGVADAAKGAGATFGATYARIQRDITASADEMRKSLKAVGDGGIEGAEKAGGAFKAFEKQLSDLTAQINRAKANGTPIAELVKLFGEEAAKATPKARAWGIAVSASVDEVSRAFNALEKQKVFDKLDDGLQKFARTLEQKQFKKLQDDFHKATEAGLKLKETLDKLEDGLQKLGDQLAKKQFGRLSEGMHESVDAVVAGLHPIHDAFEELGKQLPDLLFSALKSGEVSAILLAPAAAIGKAFGDVFQKALEASIKAGTKLSTTQKAIGLIGGAAEAFVSSFALGQGVGSPGKGALAGAGAGAAAGLPLAAATGGLSIAIGAGIGALGGLFGGRSAEKKAKESLEQNKIALAQQFGGMEKLRALAEKLGVNIAAAFDAKKPAQFQAAVDKLNAAIEAQNKRIEGLNTALAAVNTRAKLFADQFSGLVETRKGGGEEGAIAAQKIQELAQRTQPEFERLGVFVRDTVAGLIKDSGNAFQALTDLAPAFQTLKSGISDFGLTSTAVIDALVSNFDLVNNEAFKPFFENIQASGQLFKGLFDAKALSPEGFQAVAADIGQSIQSIVDRGGNIAKTLALSQPVLQGLWEAQQTFGNITDQTTQSILNQAEQQGIVGAQFKSTQDKVLAVLLAIADVFGAKIPEGIRATASAAETAGKTIESSLVGASDRSAANIETKVGRSLAGLSGKARTAASDIERELSGIDVAPIPIRLDLDTSAFDRIPDDIRINTSIDVPAFATGGIVRKRTLAIIGEAGPEAVVPLSKIESVAKPQQRTAAPRVSFGDVVINGPIDNRERAQQVVKDFARAVREGGASRTLALRTLGLEKV